MSFLISLIYFIFALGIIVIVHELGHLIVAKRNGVYCHEFSIGMGPILKEIKTDKSGCKYVIRLLPLGGYVMLAGENAKIETKEQVSTEKLLSNKSPWIRLKVLVAGSFMNFLLAIIILFFISFFGGVNNINSTQVTVIEGYPAQEANIPTNSYITSINQKEVDSFDDITKQLTQSDDVVLVEYEFDQEFSKVEVTKNSDGNIGITPVKTKFKLILSFKQTLKIFITLFLSMFISIISLFTGQYTVNDLTGPIGIYTISSQVLSLGIINALMWIAYLSMNIGLVNLLPIPALDGGRLVFVFYEMVMRKRPNAKVEEITLTIGILFLLGLFIFVTFNDISRLF